MTVLHFTTINISYWIMPQLNVWYNITLIFIIYYDTVFKILILEYYRKIGILFEYNVLDID